MNPMTAMMPPGAMPGQAPTGMPGQMDIGMLLQMLSNPAGGAMDARFSQQPLSPQEQAMLGMATNQGQQPPQPGQVNGLMAMIQQILAGLGGGAGGMAAPGGAPGLGAPQGMPMGMGY